MPYGPDDPAYGPPSPEWYARDGQAGLEPGAGAAAAGVEYARGPFEPLRLQGESGQQLAGGGTTALDQIKDFYLTAEAIGPGNLGRHIEELLERQRQLISEYFKEAGRQENPR